MRRWQFRAPQSCPRVSRRLSRPAMHTRLQQRMHARHRRPSQQRGEPSCECCTRSWHTPWIRWVAAARCTVLTMVRHTHTHTHPVIVLCLHQGKAWFGTALRHHAVAARAQFSATYPDRTATDGEAGLACFTDADLAGTVELLHRYVCGCVCLAVCVWLCVCVCMCMCVAVVGYSIGCVPMLTCHVPLPLRALRGCGCGWVGLRGRSARGNAAQFRLIVTDLARVCAHETTKDEVQMHLAVPLASSAKGSGAGTRGASEVIVLD